jgi:hypothetical protein
MVINMKANGKMISLTVKANFGMQMEIIMKVFGKTVKPTD